jgi:O-antigen/teichoic acid export membrane protein
MGLAMFSDVGLRPSIIQSTRGNDPVFLNTAWTIQIMRGVLLFLLALCISLIIFATSHFGLTPNASVYSDPHLPYVLAVVSISAVAGGFQSTKISEASRYLALGRITTIRITGQVVGLIVMISWALIERSIWALVMGNVCSGVVTTLLSHLWLPGVTNRLRWDYSAFHEIFHFGKWMFLSSILGFFANNTDRILLGGFVDSTTLGIYSIAFAIFSLITQILTKIFSDVSFAALSEVARERSAELKRSLYRFHVVTASFTYFCAGLLIVSGEALISLLYDRRYEPAGWMLEILAVALLVVPFNLAQYSLLASGWARMFSNIIAIRVSVTVLFIPLGFHFFGVSGALWGFVLGQFSSVPGVIYYQVKYDLFDLFKELLLLPMLFAGIVFGEGFNFLVGH